MKENTLPTTANKGEIILYQPNETIRLEVRMEDETVWLSQAQMAELFGTKPQNITMHIRNVYEEKELEEISTCKDFLQVRKEGNRLVKRRSKIYNLDVIISVGYRIKSPRGTKFRQWAIDVIKQHIQSTSAINNRISNVEHMLYEHQQKIDFFVRTSLPPVEGIFFENQIFDAYVFVSRLINQIAVFGVFIAQQISHWELICKNALVIRENHPAAFVSRFPISQQSMKSQCLVCVFVQCENILCFKIYTNWLLWVHFRPKLR